jgi:hypothetical protein
MKIWQANERAKKRPASKPVLMGAKNTQSNNTNAETLQL